MFAKKLGMMCYNDYGCPNMSVVDLILMVNVTIVWVTGRVHWGKGTGWIHLTLAIPIPSMRVAGYLPGRWRVFDRSFNCDQT